LHYLKKKKMDSRDAITLEQKVKYLKEVENIYRLSKKTLPPKGKTWSQIADQHLRRALQMPVINKDESLNVRKGRMMHLHSPRTARIVERTLRNGTLHPDVLHMYRGDNVQSVRDDKLFVHQKVSPAADTPDVAHFIQHSAADELYPDGHLQGFGFVPREHNVESHVPLEPAGEGNAPTGGFV
tara:strand:+ start:264 stop:812 length:549 start_codon:yes stop_codon:yes gene_type:complete